MLQNKNIANKDGLDWAAVCALRRSLQGDFRADAIGVADGDGNACGGMFHG
jgi:hypothetical protein